MHTEKATCLHSRPVKLHAPKLFTIILHMSGQRFFIARNIFFTIAIITIVCISGLIVFRYRRTVDEITSQKEIAFQNKYEALINVYGLFARGLYENVIDCLEVDEIMAEAAAARNKRELVRLREELYERLKPSYENMVDYNYRQLHFHLPDNTSFMRFHSPDNWGDDLTEVRATVRYVNETGKAAKGFEEGRIFNGYRFVFPLSFEDRHVGSVEISISMEAVIDMLRDLYGQDVQFLLSKAVMEKKVFEWEKEHYREWEVSEKYVIDLGISSSGFPEKDLAEDEREMIAAYLEEIPSETRTFHTKAVKDLIIFPIFNFENVPVAVLITEVDNEEYGSLRRGIIYILIAAAGLILLLIYLAVTIQRSQRNLDRMVAYDNLTGALSRQRFMEKLQQDIERYHRYGNVVSLILFDLDKFKEINDRQGHVIGDAVLRVFAHTVLQNIRSTDYFGRLGGDEFILALPNTGTSGAENLARLVRDRVHAARFPKGMKVTCSIGVGEIKECDTDVDGFLDRIDKALYASKDNGRDGITTVDMLE